MYTPYTSKTNIAPENRPLEKEIPVVLKAPFFGANCEFQGGSRILDRPLRCRILQFSSHFFAALLHHPQHPHAVVATDPFSDHGMLPLRDGGWVTQTRWACAKLERRVTTAISPPSNTYA